MMHHCSLAGIKLHIVQRGKIVAGSSIIHQICVDGFSPEKAALAAIVLFQLCLPLLSRTWPYAETPRSFTLGRRQVEEGTCLWRL